MAQQVNKFTITSANSTIMFRAKGIYDNWIQVQGAQTDSFWKFEEQARAEARVGVDNIVSYGYTPFVSTIDLSLEANSPSVSIFDRVLARFDADSEVTTVELMVSVPAVGLNYTFEGTFVSSHGGISGGKLLEGVNYKLTGRVERSE